MVTISTCPSVAATGSTQLRSEDGNVQHCLGEIRKKETHIIQYTHK